MKLSLVVLVVAAAGLQLGCPPTLGEHGYEEVDGGCPAKPTLLTGTGNVGDVCQDANACQPICCTCTNGVTQYLSAWCDFNTDTCFQACPSGLAQEHGFCP